MFIKDVIWKQLFGRAADLVERAVEDTNEFRIYDRNVITNRFTPTQDLTKEEMNVPNCSYFVAGIVEGILISANMDCKVSIFQIESTPQPTQPQGLLGTSQQDINA